MLLRSMLCSLLLVASVALADEDAPDAIEQVRATEIAFAQTMADRDLDAFASFLADETVFISGEHTFRGAAAVVEAWGAFFGGEAAPFSWGPEQVEVLESGDLALSTGPVRDPSGATVGTFTSIWRREDDGSWKIVFDRGCPVCE